MRQQLIFSRFGFAFESSYVLPSAWDPRPDPPLAPLATQEATAWESALEESARCDTEATPAAPGGDAMKNADESAAALSDASATALAALSRAEADATRASVLKV